MAWSYAVRLRDFDLAPREPGVYEIGFTRSNIFNPIYVGKADNSIHERLSKHYSGEGNKGVQDYLMVRERDNLWCHWMRVSDPGFTEANLLEKFRIGKDNGLYLMNRRYERRGGRV
ncbi:MAG: hypothetical protein AB9873_04870 [Syntrophobacteraceae bacterium]